MRRKSASALIAALVAIPAGAETNRIIMRVNDEILTLYDYEKIKSDRVSAVLNSDLPEERKQVLLSAIGESVLRDSFDELLLASRANQLGIEATEAEIQAGIETTKANFGIASNEEFLQALAQSGMTLEGYRRDVAKNLVVREVMNREIRPRIVIEDEDLRRYYQANPEEFRRPKRVNLKEVVVLDSAGLSEEDQMALARELGQKLLTPEGEAMISAEEEAGRATNWIEHGWVQPGDLDEQLVSAIDELAAGEVSEPVRGRGGLHLLHAIDVEEEAVRPFDEVRDEIETKERDRLFTGEMEKYRQELIDTSYIVIDAPPEAAGFKLERSSPAEPLPVPALAPSEPAAQPDRPGR